MEAHGFDVDLVLEPRLSARRAWIVASAAGGLSLILATALVLVLLLRETQVFTVLVDRQTGDAENILQVAPTGIEHQEALKQSLLVAYVSDRESYFLAGIQARLESVQRRSTGGAEESLRLLWSKGGSNTAYPPDVYGPGAEVTVTVRRITFLSPKVAQIRFLKTLRKTKQEPVTQTGCTAADLPPFRYRRPHAACSAGRNCPLRSSSGCTGGGGAHPATQDPARRHRAPELAGMYRLWKRSLKHPEKAHTCLLLFRKDAGFLRIRLNELTSSWMEPSRFEGVILRQAKGFTIITHAANEPESSHFAVQFHQYSLHGIMRLLPGLAMHMRPATNFSSRLFACVLERLPQEFGAWNRVAKSSGYIEHNDVPDLIRPVLFTIPSDI